MSEPELLILDEPFDGLDVKSRQQLADLLAQLSAQGYTWCWCSTGLMRSLILFNLPACWQTAR
ncbi:putative molybdenum transport ATP-binding protein ModF [Cedecea neteri]|uniref:Putative molybdenum transport ATP-binding protein ModF n=1 Tax=Cedecea neteri TaxID=158822 RepID=A0A2X2T3F0_9ENTR|nr:putative molybdenum transport ATP-binding protein ModF [Cedecea neteri]